MSLEPIAVSAPGKVLLTGGYLVLDRKHTGLVFGLSARIHVQVKPFRTSSGVSLQEIIVQSPQFTHAVWRYGYHLAPQSGGIEVTQLQDSTSAARIQPNEFIQIALAFSLSYINTVLKSLKIEPSTVTILADDDYYSQDNLVRGANAGKKSLQFTNFNMPISDVHKTGLGSSAALVVSFIGAILGHYLPESEFSLTTDSGKRKLHNLAQAAHSAAQGKVGSGFDVAAATFGSCVYRRFSPSLLEGLGEVGSKEFASRLQAVVDETSSALKWDTEVKRSAIKVPKSLRLVMCDVDHGSKTPGMVKQVLEWRKNSPEIANNLWSRIQKKNDELAIQLLQLADQANQDLETLRTTIEEIRGLVRKMSELSGVPIEPEAQTKLLDACSQIPGVLGGVAPGAGGFDAVALLIEDDEDVVNALSNVLASWKFQVDGTERSQAGKVRLLTVREEMEGIRVENVSNYKEWTA